MTHANDIANGEEPQSPLRIPNIHITSHNKDKKAIVHSTIHEWQKPYPGYRTSTNLVYTTSAFPVDLNDDADLKQHQAIRAEGKLGIVNPNGTVCRIVDFGPHNKVMMHRTQSLDYGVVLEGALHMELDDGTKTLMTRGDVAVQRGTMHAWINASETEWARMLFVLQDCKPLILGGERFKEDLGHGTAVFGRSGNDV
jgi:quercetin dioxygenase-like cupin family protein